MPEIDRLRSHVDQLRKEQGISREKVSVTAQRWESDCTRHREWFQPNDRVILNSIAANFTMTGIFFQKFFGGGCKMK